MKEPYNLQDSKFQIKFCFMPEPEKTFKVDYWPPVLRTLTILGSEFNNECNQYTDVKENNFRKYKQIKGK